jgi:hypothetical protein
MENKTDDDNSPNFFARARRAIGLNRTQFGVRVLGVGYESVKGLEVFGWKTTIAWIAKAADAAGWTDEELGAAIRAAAKDPSR